MGRNFTPGQWVNDGVIRDPLLIDPTGYAGTVYQGIGQCSGCRGGVRGLRGLRGRNFTPGQWVNEGVIRDPLMMDPPGYGGTVYQGVGLPPGAENFEDPGDYGNGPEVGYDLQGLGDGTTTGTTIPTSAPATWEDVFKNLSTLTAQGMNAQQQAQYQLALAKIQAGHGKLPANFGDGGGGGGSSWVMPVIIGGIVLLGLGLFLRKK